MTLTPSPLAGEGRGEGATSYDRQRWDGNGEGRRRCGGYSWGIVGRYLLARWSGGGDHLSPMEPKRKDAGFPLKTAGMTGWEVAGRLEREGGKAGARAERLERTG